MPYRYKLMMMDKVRTLAFKKAIFECVKEGDVVVDLGAGLGILSFFACQAGAKKVYAIEQEKDILEHAKDVARANGFNDKITFINDLSSNVKLPEKADVVVSETLSTMAIEENIAESLYDARKRFLKENGIIIPSSIDLCIAPIESNELFESNISAWGKDFYGFDFSVLKDTVVNTAFTRSVKPEFLLAVPKAIASFNPAISLPTFKSDNSFEASRKGVLHGIAGWFKAKLSKDTELTNSPFSEETHWQQAFFPIEMPLLVKPKDRIKVKISNELVHNRMVWHWGIEVNGKKLTYSTLKKVVPKKNINNITFYSHKPRLSEEAVIDNMILGLCSGDKTVEQIADHIQMLFPGRFKTSFLAAEKVASVLLSYDSLKT